MVWEAREEAVKIVLLGGGSELAWENGSGNAEEKPGSTQATRIVALKWVEGSVGSVLEALGTRADEGHSGGPCSEISLSTCSV